MEFDLFKYLTALGLLFAVGRLLLHYSFFVIRFLLNERTFWNPQIEKPWILVHIGGLFIMVVIFSSHFINYFESLFLKILMALPFLAAFLFCHISWLNRFEDEFSQRKTTRKKSSSHNFGLNISEIELTQLYNGLVRFDLLDQDLTTLSDFKTALTQDWKEHDSEIHFKMDGPSSREFFDRLIACFPGNNLTIKNFFQTSGVIRRADGLPYKYNTVRNALTRNVYSKKHEELNQIFQKYE